MIKKINHIGIAVNGIEDAVNRSCESSEGENCHYPRGGK